MTKFFAWYIEELEAQKANEQEYEQGVEGYAGNDR